MAQQDRDLVMKAWRIALAMAGLLLGAFGVFRLLTEIPTGSVIKVAIWLLAALIIHDMVIAPSVVGLGWTLRRNFPDRGRRYLQAALIIIAVVTVIALPMIVLRGSQPPVKALLLRDYAANLALLIGLIAVVTVASYVVGVARDSYHRSRLPGMEKGGRR
jgi:hypothetical protein